jgi:hypothetical protein
MSKNKLRCWIDDVSKKGPAYWLDKAGASGIIIGFGEPVSRMFISGKYTGPGQIDEGMGIMTGGFAAWEASKYVEERQREKETGHKVKRSPFVHAGRGMKVAGAGIASTALQTGYIENPFRAFGLAGLGVAGGAFLEYVIGKIHEDFSSKYKNDDVTSYPPSSGPSS